MKPLSIDKIEVYVNESLLNIIVGDEIPLTEAKPVFSTDKSNIYEVYNYTWFEKENDEWVEVDVYDKKEAFEEGKVYGFGGFARLIDGEHYEFVKSITVDDCDVYEVSNDEGEEPFLYFIYEVGYPKARE